jgi:hypothetical protein
MSTLQALCDAVERSHSLFLLGAKMTSLDFPDMYFVNFNVFINIGTNLLMKTTLHSHSDAISSSPLGPGDAISPSPLGPGTAPTAGTSSNFRFPRRLPAWWKIGQTLPVGAVCSRPESAKCHVAHSFCTYEITIRLRPKNNTSKSPPKQLISDS